METGLVYINEILNDGKYFRIPFYQRSYSWEEKQLKDLFNDIKYHNNGKDYYYGTILLHDKGSNIFEIVDGQQRLTSLIILINQVLAKLKTFGHSINDHKKQFIVDEKDYRIKLSSEDDDYFRNYILTDQQLLNSNIDTPSKKLLTEAKKYFLSRIINLSESDVNNLLNKLLKIKCLVYFVIDDSEAALIFETTNDRGKPLTNLEKTKSYLMYKAYLSSDNPDQLIKDIHSRFSQIYKDYEQIQSLIGHLDEDSILYNHFIAFESWQSRDEYLYDAFLETFKENLSKLVNIKGTNENAVKYINRYSRELMETFSIIKELYSKYDLISDLDILNRIAKYLPLIIKCYKHDDDSKVRFKNIINMLQIFDFRVFGILKRPKNTAEQHFHALARDFRLDYDETIEQIKDLINQYASDKDFKVALQADDFYEHIQNGDQKYLFWKYENYLRNEKQPVMPPINYKEFKSNDPRSLFSIEHVIPQSFSEKLCIVNDRKIIPENLEDDEFIEKYINCIGNLTLDTQSANSSKGKKSFQEKNTNYFKKSILKCQIELEDFLNQKKWNENSIIKRKDMLTKFCLQFWSKNG